MNLNNKTNKVASAGVAAVLSMAMAGVASAETFNANASVQTTVAITNIIDMELGSLFATSAAGSANTDSYSMLVLNADGTYGAKVEGPDAVKHPLISLGGQAAATASVVVSSTAPITLTLPDAEVTAANFNVLVTAGDSIAAANTVVAVAAADPAVAEFQLFNFTVGEVTGGTDVAACTNVTDGDIDTCVLTPTFGSTQLDFAIGASVVTDVVNAKTAYQPTTYTGTFDVTASY